MISPVQTGEILDGHTVRTVAPGRADLAQPHTDGTPYAHACGLGTHAERADDGVLRSARLRRAHHLGSDRRHADGRRLCGYPWNLVFGPGGRMEAGDERRACGRWANVPAALACRADLASDVSQRSAPRGSQRGGSQG